MKLHVPPVSMEGKERPIDVGVELPLALCYTFLVI